jgi:cation diffusion facilitator family transporter
MADVPDRRNSRRLLLVSLWLAMLVLCVKVWIGWATHSLSLLSESLQTLINGVSMLLSVIAITLRDYSGREVWGHTKLEATIALLLVAFLGFACITLLVLSGYQVASLFQVWSGGFANPSSAGGAGMTPPLLQLLGVIAATLFCLACFKCYEAMVLESPTLRFNASCLFWDVWLMLLVLTGLFGAQQGHLWLDPLLAIGMVGAAITSGYRVLNRQIPSLIRQMPIAPEALAQTIHQVEGVTHCYGIQSRGMVGRQIFVEMRLILHPDYTDFAQAIAERVERVIRERYGPAKVIIYVDTAPLAIGRESLESGQQQQ